MNPDDITAELRDIKPLIEIPEPSAIPLTAVVAIILIAFLLAAAIVWMIYRRRNRAVESDPVSDALRELDTARALLEEATSEAYAIAISNVLRRYLERHLGTRAVCQTCDEFLASLASEKSESLRGHRDALRDFLRRCDLVKFAKGELEHDQRQKLHDVARAFIQATAAPTSASEREGAPPAVPRSPALA